MAHDRAMAALALAWAHDRDSQRSNQTERFRIETYKRAVVESEALHVLQCELYNSRTERMRQQEITHEERMASYQVIDGLFAHVKMLEGFCFALAGEVQRQSNEDSTLWRNVRELARRQKRALSGGE